MERPLRPVVLCGGAGSRLWPLSTPERPKPFLALTGAETLLQQTLRRVSDPDLYGPPILAAASRHRFLAGEQAAAVGPATILLEPQALGTAFAAAAAALIVLEDEPDALLLILPADHRIADPGAFHEAVGKGRRHARDGAVVLFGVTPDGAASGYGYIRKGDPAGPAAFALAAFVEKPGAAEAERLCREGALWNAGIFLLRADRLVEELDEHEPAVADAARRAVGRSKRDADFIRLDEGGLEGLAPRSLDHAVMERTRRAVVVEADFGWSDIGAWSAVQSLCPADAAGNVAQGPVQFVDAQGVFARSEGPPLAIVGLSDVIVVAGPEGVLVAAREADQTVRQIGERAAAEAS